MRKLYRCNVTVDIDFYVVVNEAEGETIETLIDDCAQEAFDDYSHQKEIDHHEIPLDKAKLTNLLEMPYNYDGTFENLFDEIETEEAEKNAGKITAAGGQGTLFDV